MREGNNGYEIFKGIQTKNIHYYDNNSVKLASFKLYNNDNLSKYKYFSEYCIL